MEKLIMTFNEVKHLKLIGQGSEAKVYKDGDKALKIYNRYKMKNEVFQNKINKIEALADLNLPYFLLPQEIVYSPKNKFMGFSMNRINSNYDMYDYMNSNTYTLDQKIEVLKKLEKNIKLAHKNNIVLVDGNYWNFLLNDNDIYMADIDSYKVNDLKEDFLPPFYCDYYKDKVKGEINANLDKFDMGINILYFLTQEHFDNRKLLTYEKNKFYLEKYIESLDINQEIKDFFLELVSTNKEKKYIDNNIDNLSSNRSFVKQL